MFLCSSGLGTNSVCTLCRPGQYSDGTQPCQACASGTYSAGYGAASCEPCPPGTFSAGLVGCQSVVQVAATVGAWFAFGIGLTVLLLLCCCRNRAQGGDSKSLQQQLL